MAKVKLEFILLGVLLQRPQTGYELQQFMETTGRFMRANTSMTQVYRSLRSLDEDGWLEHEVEPRVGARDAKRYSVTETGRRAFFDWLREPYRPDEFAVAGREFRTRIRFRAQFLDRASVIDLVTTEIEFWERHRSLYTHRDRVEFHAPDAPIDVELGGAILNWEHLDGVARVEGHLRAMHELRDTLAAGDLPAPGLPNPLLEDTDAIAAERRRA